jgi:hypothetical protein
MARIPRRGSWLLFAGLALSCAFLVLPGRVAGRWGVLALLLGYTAYATHLDGGFRWGWLLVHLDELPGGGALSGAQVEAKDDALGRVVVVRLREGRTARWRLSLGVFRTAEPEKLVAWVRDRTWVRDP